MEDGDRGPSSLLATPTASRAGDYPARQRERFRRDHHAQVVTGFRVMSVGLVTIAIYSVMAGGGLPLDVVWSLLAIAFAVGLVALRPPRWIASNRTRRLILLHTWVSSQFVLVGFVAALDGGLDSPLLLLLFFTIAVAASGFGSGSVWIHVVMTIATVLAVGALTQTLTAGRALLWSGALLTTALSVASIARRHRGLARELKAANAELHRLARTDPLTGCLNRRALHEELEAELERYERDGTPFVVVVLDIDEFKLVNDRHGHPTGDAVLIAVAESLRRSVRGDDLLARTGGEEFAVLLRETTAGLAGPIAERLRVAIEEAGCPVRVTASAGLAAVPDHAVTGVEVVRVADRAMYEAKHAGRDQLIVAS